MTTRRTDFDGTLLQRDVDERLEGDVAERVADDLGDLVALELAIPELGLELLEDADEELGFRFGVVDIFVAEGRSRLSGREHGVTAEEGSQGRRLSCRRVASSKVG